VIGVDLVPFLPSPDPLRSQFLAWNSFTSGGGAAGPGESTSIAWTLTGLTPNSTFDMFVYGSVADVSRSFDMTIDGKTINVPTVIGSSPQQPGGVLFAGITSDASGTISGVGTGFPPSLTAANEANWSGFQLSPVAPVPEPSTLILLGTGALCLIGKFRKKLTS
jgi:PEP-CTERM motif